MIDLAKDDCFLMKKLKFSANFITKTKKRDYFCKDEFYRKKTIYLRTRRTPSR